AISQLLQDALFCRTQPRPLPAGPVENESEIVRVNVRELCTTPAETSLKLFPSRVDFIGPYRLPLFGFQCVFSLITRRSSVQISPPQPIRYRKQRASGAPTGGPCCFLARVTTNFSSVRQKGWKS